MKVLWLALVSFPAIANCDSLSDIVTAARENPTAASYIKKVVPFAGTRDALAAYAAKTGLKKSPVVSRNGMTLEFTLGSYRRNLKPVDWTAGRFEVEGEPLTLRPGEPGIVRVVRFAAALSAQRKVERSACWFCAYAEDPKPNEAMAVAMAATSYKIFDGELKIDGAPKASLMPHLKPKCAAALAQVENSARKSSRPLQLQQLTCRNGEATFRMLDPFDRKASTEIIVSKKNLEFREHLFPNSGNRMLKRVAEASMFPKVAEGLNTRAMEFHYILDEKSGEFDPIATGNALHEVSRRTLRKKTLKEKLYDLRRYYFDDWWDPKHPLLGEKTARQEVIEEQQRDETRDFGYRTSGGFSGDVGSLITRLGADNFPMTMWSERVEPYVPLVKMTKQSRLCELCAEDFDQARMLTGQQFNSSLTSGPANPDADSTD